ncbi:putative non-specific serine/threonine protein kinase [Helianthus annuus]|nr:putative non-specific serine/threonine protein kinase [Helianthus annuus]
MYSNFNEQGMEYIKQAVQEDNAGNYCKAFPLYMNAVEYFKTHLKYEKDPNIVEEVSQKFTKYLRRAEEVNGAIHFGGAGVVTAQPKTKLKEGEADGEDPKGQLSRVKTLSFREQAIEYVKQAVQEDSAGNYAKVFPLYMNALEYFKTYAKYENNYKIREAVMHKFNEYLRRAEEIRAVLDEDRAGPGTSGGHAAMPKGGSQQ